MKRNIWAACLLTMSLFLLSCGTQQKAPPTGMACFSQIPAVQQCIEKGELPQSLLYRRLGETAEEYVVSDAEKVQETWQAILQIRIGKETDQRAEDDGDCFLFSFANGETCAVSFSGKAICMEGKYYRIEKDAPLWKIAACIRNEESEKEK